MDHHGNEQTQLSVNKPNFNILAILEVLKYISPKNVVMIQDMMFKPLVHKTWQCRVFTGEV